jgi:hypothetical protein
MVNARLTGSLPVIFLAVTRHGDDDRVPANLLLSQPCSYRVSIDRRKADEVASIGNALLVGQRGIGGKT